MLFTLKKSGRCPKVNNPIRLTLLQYVLISEAIFYSIDLAYHLRKCTR